MPKFLENLEPYWSNIVDLGSGIFRWRRVWTANLDVLTTATVPTPVNTTDATTKAYVDALFVGVAPTIREVDLAPSLSGSTILEFDQADGFVLSNPGGTTARLDLAAIPVTILAGSFADLGSTLTGTLLVVDGGTGAGTFTDNGVLIGNGTGAIAVTAALTNGQLVIGSTGVDPVPAALTAGTGIQITPAAGSITIATNASPAGSIHMYGGTVAPSGWLLCDGTSYTTAGQADLFAAIGYAFGGAGANFNVPDMRSRSPVGTGQGAGLTNRAIAATGGVETHPLVIAELAAHTHESFNTSAGAGATGVALGQPGPSGAAGSGTAHQTMHPFLVVTFIIKT